MPNPIFFPSLISSINQLESQLAEIPRSRREELQKLGDYIVSSKDAHRKVQLLFVCTHNSRRSHIAQVWAHTFAQYYGISDVYSYSGGTESTAFNANAVAALTRCGFEITDDHTYKNNPRYRVSPGSGSEDIICYSKRFNEPPNPEVNFAAIMVCSDADENCPVIPGVENRISLPYEDPKNYDGTSEQDDQYDLTCRAIGKELLLSFKTASERIKANAVG